MALPSPPPSRHAEGLGNGSSLLDLVPGLEVRLGSLSRPRRGVAGGRRR